MKKKMKSVALSIEYRIYVVMMGVFRVFFFHYKYHLSTYVPIQSVHFLCVCLDKRAHAPTVFHLSISVIVIHNHDETKI